MPKTITATDTAIESLAIQIDETGAVTGLTAVVNVGYGERQGSGSSLTFGLSLRQANAPHSRHCTIDWLTLAVRQVTGNLPGIDGNRIASHYEAGRASAQPDARPAWKGPPCNSHPPFSRPVSVAPHPGSLLAQRATLRAQLAHQQLQELSLGPPGTTTVTDS